MLAESEHNIKFLREAIEKERLAVAAEKAALENLQAAEAIQNDHKQRSNQWEISPLIHLLHFLRFGKGKILNKVITAPGYASIQRKNTRQRRPDQYVTRRILQGYGPQPSHFPRVTLFLLISLACHLIRHSRNTKVLGGKIWEHIVWHPGWKVYKEEG